MQVEQLGPLLWVCKGAVRYSGGAVWHETQGKTEKEAIANWRKTVGKKRTNAEISDKIILWDEDTKRA